MGDRRWNVYLAGEIHTSWREEIRTALEAKQTPVRILGPELNHEKSDACGDQILGEESESFWRDHKAAKINSIRNRSVLKNSDVIIVKFGDKYRQWNAAFDAGFAIASGASVVTLHEEGLDHALKEIDAVALAVCRNVSQVVGILEYISSRPF